MSDESNLKLAGTPRGTKGLAPSKSGWRTGGQNAILISVDVHLALALGRLAEIQHVPLTLFWSLQAAADAPLLSADVAMVDLKFWHELQRRKLRRLDALMAAIPIVLLLREGEQDLLPMRVAENVQVVVLPPSGAAPVVLQVAIRAMKDFAQRGLNDEIAGVLPLPAVAPSMTST